jgi:hypothetical protein
LFHRHCYQMQTRAIHKSLKRNEGRSGPVIWASRNSREPRFSLTKWRLVGAWQPKWYFKLLCDHSVFVATGTSLRIDRAQ